MKTKIVYVLVSGPNDIYLEQARISIASLKYHMPKVNIALVIDNLTKENLKGIRSIILDEVNEIIVVDLDSDLNGQKRSRILKTSVRNYIEGDYLFIDCDTIILDTLDEIDTWSFEIGACYDSHALFKDNPYREMCISHCKVLGYNISEEDVYFNSGVMFVKDTPLTHDFYKKWNQRWLDGAKLGVFMDQPSLAFTNISYNHIITPIPDIWNCQILHGIKFLPQAKILHYLCTNSEKNGDIFILRGREIFEQIKLNGKIPTELYPIFDDAFEGIPQLTYLQSADITKVFLTPSWYLFKKLNKLGFNKISDFLLYSMYSVWRKVKFTIKK